MNQQRKGSLRSALVAVVAVMVAATLALVLALAGAATARAGGLPGVHTPSGSSGLDPLLFPGRGAALLAIRTSGLASVGAIEVRTQATSAGDRCSGCHNPPEPFHWGLACGQCHSASRFLPTKVAPPIHPMPLLGRHATVRCSSCHTPARVMSTECTACHTAPKAHLPGTCSSCHGPEGWAKSAAAAGIVGPAAPHRLSPADDCLVCHDPTGPNWPARATHTAYSLGQCGLCHRSSGKASVTKNHERVSDLFRGRHTQLACVQCHSNGQFQGTAQICGACHQADDHHGGQFGQNCGRCHSPDGWAGVTFDHSQTQFPLTGAHANTACTSCHSGGTFAGTPRDCAACHSEPAYHAGVLGTNCAACHNPGGWLPASYGGPHTFPLNHQGASGCRTCHTNSLASYTCFGCHNEAEIRQKHLEHGIPNPGNCVACHANGQGG